MTASITFGSDDSVLSRYTLGTNKEMNINNTSSTGKIIMKLGTDTTATKYSVKNSSDTDLFSVKGDGTVYPLTNSGGSIIDYIHVENITANNQGTTLTIDGNNANYTSILNLSGSAIMSSNNWNTNGSNIRYTGTTTKKIFFKVTIIFNGNPSGIRQYQMSIRKPPSVLSLKTVRGVAKGSGTSTSCTLIVDFVLEMAQNDEFTAELRCTNVAGSVNIKWHTIRIIAHD